MSTHSLAFHVVLSHSDQYAFFQTTDTNGEYSRPVKRYARGAVCRFGFTVLTTLCLLSACIEC